jgi:hypothetical protein
LVLQAHRSHQCDDLLNAVVHGEADIAIEEGELVRAGPHLAPCCAQGEINVNPAGHVT